eukprot:m.365123 g.365123  ORF g.365123 m.365123 type:complete len:116 (+) comp30037_c0_seq1:743-1090(+)
MWGENTKQVKTNTTAAATKGPSALSTSQLRHVQPKSATINSNKTASAVTSEPLSDQTSYTFTRLVYSVARKMEVLDNTKDESLRKRSAQRLMWQKLQSTVLQASDPHKMLQSPVA